ncbi:nucleoside triphosphate pyrophosphohydrolase [Moraxella sp. K02]
MQPTSNFADLIALMARLRQDCPWDKKQTNDSLIPYALEETYELVEAIQSGDIDDIKGELGDVLLQVVFHTCLYQEQQQFDISEVIFTLQQKLIRRHPHVFDKENLKTDEDVKKRWDEIKALENAEKAKRGKLVKHRRTLDAVKAGSALMQAQQLQKTANKVGFDWDVVSGAVDKLDEEVAELKEILPIDGQKPTPEQKALLEKELGDCFFALVNIARKLGIDSEKATLTTVHKFRSRFGFIEDELAKMGKTPETASLAEMDNLWDLAKLKEKHDKP